MLGISEQVRELRERLAKQPQAHQVVEEAGKSHGFWDVSIFAKLLA